MIPIMIFPSFDVKIKLLYEMYKKVFAAFESLQRNNIPMFYSTIASSTVCLWILYTPVKSYVVKQPQEKWACDFHDDALPLSFQLQVTEDFF